jgi:hypothetical protein
VREKLKNCLFVELSQSTLSMLSMLSKLSNDLLSVLCEVFPSYLLFPIIDSKLTRVEPRLEKIVDKMSKWYWRIKQVHDDRKMRYKKKGATIHLVRMSDFKKLHPAYTIYPSYQRDKVTNEEIQDRVINISLFERVYPGLVEMMDRGDAVEFIDVSGYRSNGVLFFDGKKLIEQYRYFDDYGSPPIEFGVLTEFPPGYYDKPNMRVNNKYVNQKDKSKFYWHSNDGWMALYYEKVGFDLRKLRPQDLPRDVIIRYKGLNVKLHCTIGWSDIDVGANQDTSYIMVKFESRYSSSENDNFDYCLTTKF